MEKCHKYIMLKEATQKGICSVLLHLNEVRNEQNYVFEKEGRDSDLEGTRVRS